MKLGEVFLEGLVGVFIVRKLDEVHNLGGVSMVEGSHAVLELGEAGGNAADSKLGLCLSKPNSSIICPELRELDSDCVEVEGGRGHGFGYGVEKKEGTVELYFLVLYKERSHYFEEAQQ